MRVELLAEAGFEALTMRSLALRLDVSPNALYSHVVSKTALIDDVLDDVLREVEAPDPDTEDPSVGLHAIMASTRDVLLAHADLVPLFVARHGARGPMPKAWARLFSAFWHGKAWTGPEPAKRFVSSSFTRSGSQLSPPRHR